MSAHVIQNYTFNSITQTVRFNDYRTVYLAGIKLITNVTTGTIIFQFNDGTKNGTVSNNVVTLDYDTTSMSNTDQLMIIYEEPSIHSDSETWIGLLARIWQTVKTPPWTVYTGVGPQVRVLMETSSNINAINSLGNITQFGSVDSRWPIWNGWGAEYKMGIRSKIQ
jgi:hypothetical protein